MRGPAERTAYHVTPNISGASYDVAPDGERFLMVEELPNDERSTTTPASLVVVPVRGAESAGTGEMTEVS